MVIFNLRMNEDLYEQLKQVATQEDRSINGMLLHIIKKYFESV